MKECIKSILDIKLIIVHGGTSAHRDEIYGCALLQGWRMIHDLEPIPIERRNPTDEELDDLSVLVLDVGRSHDPSRHNFDHHQFPAGDHNPSAFELLARYMFPENGPYAGYFNVIKELVEAISCLDNYGPIVLKKKYGEHIFLLTGIEFSLMFRWAEDPNGIAGELFTEWMTGILQRSEKLAIRYTALDQFAHLIRADLLVIDQPLSGDEFPESFGISDWLQQQGEKPLISIGWDKDRNTGDLIVKVSRLEAGELLGVDLNYLRKHEASWRFIHNNGFVAFANPGVDQKDVIEQVTALLVDFHESC